jgi:Glu-tRNA(Gln) amidotransferase subunit E-like FAD-binding protein
MKITKKYLQKLIKEEYEHLILESDISKAVNALHTELAKIPGSDENTIADSLGQILVSLEEIKQEIEDLKGKA